MLIIILKLLPPKILSQLGYDCTKTFLSALSVIPVSQSVYKLCGMM